MLCSCVEVEGTESRCRIRDGGGSTKYGGLSTESASRNTQRPLYGVSVWSLCVLADDLERRYVPPMFRLCLETLCHPAVRTCVLVRCVHAPSSLDRRFRRFHRTSASAAADRPGLQGKSQRRLAAVTAATANRIDGLRTRRNPQRPPLRGLLSGLIGRWDGGMCRRDARGLRGMMPLWERVCTCGVRRRKKY